MSRHAYVRVTHHLNPEIPYVPIEVIAGVELQPMYTLRSQYDRLARVLKTAMTPVMAHNYSDEAINGAVEEAIKKEYGDKLSYFIEVGRGDMDEYVQVYQP